jgi:poly(A)-specific ribonuclease
VRSEINVWMKMGSPGDLLIADRINIADKRLKMLTSFDRRLVHQLVRAEYPQFVTMARDNCVVIKPLDVEREKRYQEGKKAQLRQKISQQTGFRWIFEALCGGNFHGIDYTMFAKDPATGEARFCDIDDYSARLSRAKQSLQRRKPPLVGHNVFQDLIYLYKTFVGTLPPTVDEFCKLIHEMFPTVVDTKYLATHNCGDLNPSSSLGEIEAELRVLRTPEIILHNYHRKYRDEAPHEAGYDSYLTARVMIQLSTKLEALGTYSLDGVAHLDGYANPNLVSYLTCLSSISSIGGCMPNDQGLRPFQVWTLRDNAYAQIQNLGRNMPPFMSDFWRVYGNKLRAFGTVERLINLANYDISPEDAIRVRMFTVPKFLRHSWLTTLVRIRCGTSSSSIREMSGFQTWA